MSLWYNEEDEDSFVEYPWYAYRSPVDRPRQYVAVAETETELVDYLRKTYPDEEIKRSYE